MSPIDCSKEEMISPMTSNRLTKIHALCIIQRLGDDRLVSIVQSQSSLVGWKWCLCFGVTARIFDLSRCEPILENNHLE